MKENGNVTEEVFETGAENGDEALLRELDEEEAAEEAAEAPAGE